MKAMSRISPEMCVGLGALFLAGANVACVEQGPKETLAITNERTWRPEGRDPSWGLSSAQRFGLDREPERPAASGTVWDTPSGWVERAPSSMRAASFLVAGDERAECYLTVLGGDGGGLLSNVNRWRGQMSLPPIEAEALESAPHAPLFGSKAVLVDFEGTWTGMASQADGQGYRLVGLLSVEGGQARFLKMIGPADVLESELDAFLTLAASFREREVLVGAHDAAHASPGSGRGSSLSWTAPEGWRQGAARPAREVTFLLGERDEGECYVTILGGTGGGAFANVNRWRNQMGQTDLNESEFDELQRIPMLGTQGVVVEVAGSYRGMGDELVEQAILIGVVCELPNRAVFVKLTGPEDVVRPAHEAFLAFCESLESGG